MRRAVGILLVASTLTSVVGVFAQERRAQSSKTTVSAMKKKRDGDLAFRAQRYADALKAYDSAYELTSDPVLHFDRGRTLEALERYEEAIAELAAFERDASPELRERMPEVLESLRALERKLTTVRFVVQPEGARIFVRAAALGVAPLEAPARVVSGKARVEVVADGYVGYVREHYLGPGERTTISIALAPMRTAVAGPTAPTPTATPSDNALAPVPAPIETAERPSVLTRWWFWTAAGVVVAGGAVAAFALTRPPERREPDIGQITAPLGRF